MDGNHLCKQSISGLSKVVLFWAPFFNLIVPSLLTPCNTGLKETYHFLPHLLRKQKQFEFQGSLREVTAGTQFRPGRLWMSSGETDVYFQSPISWPLASTLFPFPGFCLPKSPGPPLSLHLSTQKGKETLHCKYLACRSWTEFGGGS